MPGREADLDGDALGERGQAAHLGGDFEGALLVHGHAESGVAVRGVFEEDHAHLGGAHLAGGGSAAGERWWCEGERRERDGKGACAEKEGGQAPVDDGGGGRTSRSLKLTKLAGEPSKKPESLTSPTKPRGALAGAS